MAAGCATTVPPETDEFPEAQDVKLLLQPGDVLRIRFAYWPELDEEQTIRPDGLISLQLAGEVTAAGKTPGELREELLSLYEDKLIDPVINVVVHALASHRVYVGGEVLAPGLVPIQGKLTLLEAIMHCGGFNKETARISSVVVIRRREGQQFAKSVDLRNMLESAQSETFYLEPYDVVFVPRTAIDRVDQFVEQYINKIVPRNLHASFGYSVYEDRDPVETTNVPVTGIQLTAP